jgi:ABC-type Mn2+/Zn2+ transport system permease subunit
MSAVPRDRRPADTVAGFLAAFAIAIAAIGIVRTPGLLAPVAILLALVAARMSEAYRTLAGWAVGLSTLAFFLGMVVAIATENPIF